MCFFYMPIFLFYQHFPFQFMLTEITDAPGRRRNRVAVILLPSLFLLHNAHSFPFQPTSKLHRYPYQFSSSGAFQNSEDCNVAIPSKCGPLPMPIISQCGGLTSELYTSQFWRVWREVHHRLPLVTHWRLSVVSPMCSSHQHIKGARKREVGVAFKNRLSETVPTRFAQDPWALPRYLCNVLVVCEHSSIHTIPPHIVLAFHEPVISKENRILWINLVW